MEATSLSAPKHQLVRKHRARITASKTKKRPAKAQTGGSWAKPQRHLQSATHQLSNGTKCPADLAVSIGQTTPHTHTKSPEGHTPSPTL